MRVLIGYDKPPSVRVAVRVLWDPRDLWVGVFWNEAVVAGTRFLLIYVTLVPCFPICFSWKRLKRDVVVRRCTYCRGKGCDECDNTGKRYRAMVVGSDGAVGYVSGSGDGNLSAETVDALRSLIDHTAAKLAGGAS